MPRLSEISGFDELPASVRQEMQEMCRLRNYNADQTIMDIGALADMIGIVRHGIIRMQKTMLDGRHHVVSLFTEGDMFGRMFGIGTHFAIEAATDAEVFTFQRRPFEALVSRSPELEHLLLTNLCDELDRARDWMIILAMPKVRARLAGFLLILCRRFSKVDHLIRIADRRILVSIPISRPDLAHLLGTRVESISRAFHELADDGVIKICRPDLIEIRRIEDLYEEAGESDLTDPIELERLVRISQKPVA